LEQDGLSMTRFTSDSTDRENNVWDKIFLNLEDFGKIFANGRAGVPNVYGPILFRFRPNALYEMADVAVCLRSAGAKGFDRKQESLKSIEDVDRIFYYPVNDPQGRTAALKFKSKLRQSFGEGAQSIEISCTNTEGVLSLFYLEDVVVDPYRLNDTRLSGVVSDTVQEAGSGSSVKERVTKVDIQMYQHLLQGARSKPPKPTVLARMVSSAYLKEWAREIESRGGILLHNYYRYLRYLYEGTVLPVQERIKSEAFAERSITAIEIGTEFPAEDISPHLLDEEFKLIIEDIAGDQADWARSSEKGWFYSDEDDLFY
jgi:hypothetical protein